MPKPRLRSHALLSPRAAIALAALLACLALGSAAFAYGKNFFAYVGENVSYALHPTAALAFEYGEAHFSQNNPAAYNIDYAEHFLNIAADDDPGIPYVYHELARIAFLRGDFSGALSLINIQILNQGDATPNSYYVRALIEGFAGDYADSEQDYAYFLQFDQYDWAGVNDYAWVLLKDGKPQAAAAAIEKILAYSPHNPWLLNSDAIALYEMGSTTAAKARIAVAAEALKQMSPGDWSHAYPGNNPAVAAQGLATFKTAVLNNMHSIDAGAASSTLQ